MICYKAVSRCRGVKSSLHTHSDDIRFKIDFVRGVFMSKGLARVRGIEMVYDDTGGNGAALVLLHGFPFDRSMWRGQASALGGEFRVVAPDLRGLGETPLGEGNVTIEVMAEDVCALLDELQLESVVLGGLSMGGY